MKAIRNAPYRWSLVAKGMAIIGSMLVGPNPARADNSLGFNGGPIKNFVVDLIFWEKVAISERDRLDVLEYVSHFCGFLNGDTVAGQEAAAHWYGLAGCVPGYWIDDPNPIPADIVRGSAGLPAEPTFLTEIAMAHSGAFGPSYTFSGQVAANALPTGANRLAMVITRGTNLYAQTEHIIGHPLIDNAGEHGNDGGVSWGATMLDPDGLGTRNFSVTLSHEIIEAMTDVTGDGWVTDQGFLGLLHAEACDSCGGDTSQQWIASTGDDISGISQMVLDPSFGGINNVPQNSCQLYQPEEYAPLTVTLEPNRGGVALDLFYRTPTGHLSQLAWTETGASATGPVDWGQPITGSVRVAGKPSAVYGFSPGATLVFVRGSDNALWMLSAPQGQWVSLGGILFGDPGAAVTGGTVHVFVVGTDANIYTKVITNNVPTDWQAIGNNNFGIIIGAPKALMRTPTTVDLFAVGDNLLVNWASFSTSFGWSTLSYPGGEPIPPFLQLTPVGISSWGENRLDIASNYGGIHHRAWTGSWGADETIDALNFGVIGTPAIASWAPGRLDVFIVNSQNQLLHAYRSSDTDPWHGDVNNPMRTDAVGDPAIISRGPGELDVFYRTTTGSLTHLNFNSQWTVEADILSSGSIQ